jgi:hypothetical protein
MLDPSGSPEFLGIWKETKRYKRGKNRHEHNGDRIVVPRIRIVLYSLQAALQSNEVIKHACQHDCYEFVDELSVIQIADRFVLAMKNESLFVAPMRQDFLQLGIRQIRLQLVLESGLAFRSRNLGKKSSVPPRSNVFSQVFLSRRKNRSAVSQAKWR